MMDVPATANRLSALAGDLGPAPAPELFSQGVGSLLPADHAELLEQVNGATVFHGAFRLFGFGRDPWLDLVIWNAPDTWRFAWDDRVAPFFCFAGTAWGDQYAYRLAESGEGFRPEVYFLDGMLMGHEVIAEDFGRFMTDEFLRNAEEPYDNLTVEMVGRGGDIPASKHWVYTPSPAIGGPELLENVMELPAVTAMVIAGDIVTAVDAEPERQPTMVIPWTDSAGRGRMRVSFEQ